MEAAFHLLLQQMRVCVWYASWVVCPVALGQIAPRGYAFGSNLTHATQMRYIALVYEACPASLTNEVQSGDVGRWSSTAIHLKRGLAGHEYSANVHQLVCCAPAERSHTIQIYLT